MRIYSALNTATLNPNAGFFQHKDGFARPAGVERGGQPGGAAAHDDNIEVFVHSGSP